MADRGPLATLLARPGQPPHLNLIDGLAGIQGVTIRVRHDLPDASVRLMCTLGVVVVVAPDAPECVRFHDRSGVRQRCRRCVRVERGRAA